jgi:hypothetical protein
MTHTAATITLAALVAWSLAGPASAGMPWWPCHDTAGGTTTPCGDTGCGPRYCGEKHEPSRPDPCDCCNRWVGCNGERQPPDMLAPWQLPPGRGFQGAADVGYHAEPCGPCGVGGTCGPCGGLRPIHAAGDWLCGWLPEQDGSCTVCGIQKRFWPW